MTIVSFPCAAEGCTKGASRPEGGRGGFCGMHYQRNKKYGNPHQTKTPESPAIDWIAANSSFSSDECLLWPFHIGKDGYGRVHQPGSGRLTTASRLMCVVAHGPPPAKGYEAAHSCGKGHLACVNPIHLYWATTSRNHADKIEHGTTNRGERQGAAKLTEADVLEIRSLLGSLTQAEIARQFGVDPSHISDIKHGKKWGWLRCP